MHTDTSRRLDAWLAAADALLAEPAAVPGDETGNGESDPPVLLGKLWARFRKERDLELHVFTGWLFGTEFVQLLDFVPSRGVYGNELLIHAALLSPLTEAIQSLVRYRGKR